MTSSPALAPLPPVIKASEPTPRLNIVHYLPTIYLAEGGVARAVLDWCIVFAQRGHNVTLLTYNGSEVPPNWFSGEPGVPRAIAIEPNALARISLTSPALDVCKNAIQNADIVHLHAPWLPGNRQLARIAQLFNIPYIVTIHGMLDDWAMSQKGLKKRLYMLMFGRRFLNLATAVHCTADAEAQQAAKRFRNRNVPVLPCLIDLEPFEKMPGTPLGLSLIPKQFREKKKILFLSRLHEKKGVDILIKAAARLRDAGTDFVLLLAGTGNSTYTEYLKNLTTKLHLNDHVLFLGLVIGNTKISLYQCADIFVLPTLAENFGLVLAEALASGLPVITTKGTDIWQEIERAGGLIVDAAPTAFANAIITLLDDPTKRQQLGRQGREWAFNTLATGPLAEKYEALYRNPAQQSTR